MKANKDHTLRVFMTNRQASCEECGEELAPGRFITLDRNRRVYCLSCMDLDHLVFLPAGDAALTRRAQKHSRLSAIVYRWSRARKRNERQGVLVEERALSQAEAECLADEEARARRRERAAQRRARLDAEYVAQFARKIRELYPAAPPGVEVEVAEHACQKYSGRVGRSAEAKALSPRAVTLAVVAYIRHNHTNYDELLALGWSRDAARDSIRDEVDEILSLWAKSAAP